MSSHPIHSAPPFWGPPNYTQPWTTPQPPSSGPIPQPQPFNPDPSSTPQQYHNLESFYGNSHLPGLGGAAATGSFPPPPFAFPGSFPPAPAPPHLAMPHMGYPLMPGQLPTHSYVPQPQPQPSTNNLVHPSQSNATDSQPMAITSSRQDLDREEGELTDLEGATGMDKRGFRRPKGRAGGNWKYHGAGNGRDHGLQAEQSQLATSDGLHPKHDDRSAIAAETRRESLSEIEEGEALPEPRASSRDSGSPYNPPMPTEAISPPMPKALFEPMKTTSEGMGALDSLLPSSVDQHSSSINGVSLAQLRVQAQGALLSLAPHSIRYSELVGEGINPTILKQLYEEVGIKVPTTPLADLDPVAGSSDNLQPGASTSVINEKENQPTQHLEAQHDATPKLTSIEARPTLHSNQPNTAKPMERKDMIARMLAAKAAKSSSVPAPTQPDIETTVSSPQALPSAVDESTTTTPSQDTSVNEKEARVKEKNKAQTELARQRIEQLKKQGLMRNLQKPSSDSLIPEKELQNSVQEAPQAHASWTVQHPLPERPPVPESASLDQIPGLFMTDKVPEAINGAHVTPIQESIPESAPYPRSSQRKRPRASDFDEPIPLPKRAFSNSTSHEIPERLVIDISDDEFYGDEEEASVHAETAFADPSDALTAEGLIRVYPPPADGLPHRPATSQSQGLSTSSTPNNLKNTEQEDLRKKDLQIQAMHRRIAELEQRKKAKLASRTQSPRASDLSPPELVNMPEISTPSMLNIDDKGVDDILGPMDADGLRKMKSKILRIQEIEAGVPSLDAEIHKSEMKLADTRSEEERLSSELAKGKEGRRQLLQELNTLKLEVSGLSLDRVNVALIDMEAKEKMPVDVVQGMLRRLSIPGYQRPDTTTYNHYAIAQGYENKELEEDTSAAPELSEADEQAHEDTTLAQHANPPTSKPPAADDVPDVPDVPNVDIPIPDAPAAEPSDTSMSEDSSSSMDESTDDSSSDSGSLNEEIPDAQYPNMDPTAPMEEMVLAARGLSNGPQGSQPEDALSTDKAPNAPTQTDMLSRAGAAESENLDSPESPASEAYEPPEPEESASASDTSYSPAPSPDFPSPDTNMEILGSSEEQSQVAGEPLTEKVQELDLQQPSQYPQIGLLDNTRRPEDSQRKFSPYTSPLKLFKAYRYHPDYNDKVSGGYRSLTYSHNIDPLKHFCPFETSGGVCNDRSCEYQHFRDMALSDDKILVQMGSLREGKTPEECDSYVAGLKETINDMRRDRVKDMNTVATEIAGYRRRFLQDPTRVLAL